MENQSELFRLVGLSSRDPKYEYMAAELFISSLEDGTSTMERKIERRSDAFLVKQSKFSIPAETKKERNKLFKYFGIQTLARSYLINDETPQELYLRVAITLFENKDDVMRYYDALSHHRISNATPIMLNCGTNMQQLSSCFQLGTADDLCSLFDTIKSVGMISKWSGGVSVWLHGIRGEGSLIKSTGGICSGTKHFVKLLNSTKLYVNQGGNRKGAVAVYMAVDHSDILTFIGQSLVNGDAALTNVSAPDITYALWVSDLFMKKLYEQLTQPNNPEAGDWYIFCPSKAPGLSEVYGDEYEKLYDRYVAEGKYERKIKTRAVVEAAFKSWNQAGVPYVLFKDAINKKSNMKNVAPIQSSNLCCEITIPSWTGHEAERFGKFHPDNTAGGEIGVCNLAAICLESFVDTTGVVDWNSIIEDAGLQCNALNRVIDINQYPDPDGERSNKRHRPIGIGIIGLADLLAIKKQVYGSPEALATAQAIAAVIYYGALKMSCYLARRDGAYGSYEGSPMSQGKLQPDLWGEDREVWELAVENTTGKALTRQHWADLRAEIAQFGIRNAYLIAYMPTATTSNVVGQNECFEPFTSNIYTRKTLAGQFTIANKHLVRELSNLGLWSDKMCSDIINLGGSVQKIDSIPQEVRDRYKTVRELGPGAILNMCRIMAPFICQSMSMNLFLEEPSLPKILSFLVSGWKKGLKTGMYYCHTQPASGSQKDKKIVKTTAPAAAEDKSECASCSI